MGIALDTRRKHRMYPLEATMRFAKKETKIVEANVSALGKGINIENYIFAFCTRLTTGIRINALVLVCIVGVPADAAGATNTLN